MTYHCNFCKDFTCETKEEFLKHALEDPIHIAKGQKYLALYNAEKQSNGRVSVTKFIAILKQVSEFKP